MNKRRLFMVVLLLLVAFGLSVFISLKINLKNVISKPEPVTMTDTGRNYSMSKGLFKSRNGESVTITIDGAEKVITLTEKTKFNINHRSNVTKPNYELDLVDATKFFSQVKMYDEIAVTCPAVGACNAISLSVVKK